MMGPCGQCLIKSGAFARRTKTDRGRITLGSPATRDFSADAALL